MFDFILGDILKFLDNSLAHQCTLVADDASNGGTPPLVLLQVLANLDLKMAPALQ